MSSESGKIQRTDEEQKRSIEIYDNYRDELNKRQLSNTENYDKAILTLSSAGLAISLSFIKNIVTLENAQYLYLLKASWTLFLLSIVVSLVAYLIGNAAISRQLRIAEDYYVNKLISAQTEKNRLSQFNNIINYTVGLFFVLAISILVVFVIFNIQQESKVMSDKNTKVEHVRLQESATVPSMQRVPEQGDISIHSAQIPSMQAAPGSTSASQSAPQQSQTQNESSDSNKG